MDYILEILVRQERLWSGLFPALSPEAPQTAEAPYGKETGAELAGAAPSPWQRRRRPLLWRRPWTGKQPAAEPGAGEAEAREAGLMRTGVAKAPGEAQVKAGRAAGETAESGELLAPVRQDGESKGADAQAISLALERDARRYDGGYVLY